MKVRAARRVLYVFPIGDYLESIFVLGEYSYFCLMFDFFYDFVSDFPIAMYNSFEFALPCTSFDLDA